MKTNLRLLHLEDDPHDAEIVQSILEAEGFDCQLVLVRSRTEFQAALEQERFDLILSDFGLPNYNGLSALELAQRRQPEAPFILVSGTLGEEQAVESLKSGATDYVLKGRLTRLVPAVRRALQETEKRAELRRAEEAMAQSEYKYRHLFESLGDSAFLFEEESLRIIDTNSQAERLLGLTRAEILGRGLESFHSAPDIAGIRRRLAAVSEAGIPVQDEALVIARSGTKVPVDISVAPITLYDRKLMLALYRDVTRHKVAEERIRDQARLLDLAQDAIVVRDLQGLVRYANKAAERLFGWESAEILRGAVRAPVFADAKLSESAEEELLKRGEWSGEVILLAREGKPITVLSRSTLVRDGAGAPQSILTINTDITEKKKLEEQFLRIQRLEGIGTLASGIAHDLNNILAPIMMAAPLLQWDRSEAETEKTLAIIESNAKRGAEIVRQLLTFGRGVEGERVLVQVTHLAKEMVKIMRETFPKSLVLASRIDPDVWPVTGDATQLHQVLLNLCVNSRDAMPNGGHLTLNLQNVGIDTTEAAMNPEARVGRYVRVTVTDTGLGIPTQIIARIFDPFFTTKAVGKGSGLGLSTALGIVKSHGGFIQVRSEMGRGTTFDVYLPASGEVESIASVTTLPPAELKRGRGETILVVDDEPRIREITQVLLQEHGYKAVTAADGIEALTLFAQRRHQIALVLTDLLMPLLDGVSLVRGLQKMDPQVKVIVTSGIGSSHSLQAKQSELQVLGVSTILSKPFRAVDLLNALQENLQKAS